MSCILKIPRHSGVFDERENLHLIFGHWASLGGKTGTSNIIAIDTGCVWGYKLSAFRLEDNVVFSYDRLN